MKFIYGFLVLLIFTNNLFALDKLEKINFDNNYKDKCIGVGSLPGSETCLNYQFTPYNSIELYANEAKDIFLEKIFLKNGAKIIPYANSKDEGEYVFNKATALLNEIKGASTIINATEFSSYKNWSLECYNPFSGTSCSETTKLVYPIYREGIMLKGERDSLDTKNIGMLLYIDNKNKKADIYDVEGGSIETVSGYYKDIKDKSNNSSISIITGKYLDLNEDTWQKEKEKDKRTAIAIGDSDNDGIGDIIYILVAQQLTLVEVAQYFKELKVIGVDSKGKCSDKFCTNMKAMWLDSGGSSQVADRLINTNGIKFGITENRYVPSFLVVYDGVKNNLFNDIDKNYWAYKYINELVEINIIQGYPDGSFKPKNNITIGEFLKIISRAIIKFSKNDEKKYKNINGKIFSRYVNFLKDRKVDMSSLTQNTTMNSLKENATRGYVAKVISNSIKYFDSKAVQFKSCRASDDEDWDECSLYLKERCIVNGVLKDNKHLYKPNDFINRDEIVKIIYYAIHHIREGGVCDD